MKYWFLPVLCLLAPTLTTAAELVITCDIGGKSSSRVQVLRTSKIADTYVYSLRVGGGTQPLFGDKDSSRGSSVEVTCAGHRTRALVVTGQFTSNFLQGVVLSQNPNTGVVERMDFAEKNRPTLLYLDPSKTLIVIPTHGYGETEKKFVVYEHAVGTTGEAEAIPADELLAQLKAEVIRLPGESLVATPRQ